MWQLNLMHLNSAGSYSALFYPPSVFLGVVVSSHLEPLQAVLARGTSDVDCASVI